MDQNVIARSCVPYHQVPDLPKIKRIFVRDLAEASGGNATGIGNADFTTERLVKKIDKNASYMNVITAAAPEIIRIPIHFKTDREVLDLTSATILDFNLKEARIIRIKNTLELPEMMISEALISGIKKLKNIEICGYYNGDFFDNEDNFSNWWS